MPSIVISYRRADTGQIAGRIFDRLEAHFGRDSVFMDIDGVPIGTDFRDRVKSVLGNCDVVIALVGSHWADGGAQRDRLSDEADWVRIEVETALANKVPVIPVLIDQAQFPPAANVPPSIRDIVFKQAARVDTGIDFGPHMDRLIRSLDGFIEAKTPAAPGSAATKAKAERAMRDAHDSEARRPERDTGGRANAVGPLAELWALFSARGRTNRSTWWILVATGFVYCGAAGEILARHREFAWYAVSLIPAAALIFAASARRSHDRGRNAWWALPSIGLAVFLGWSHLWLQLGDVGTSGSFSSILAFASLFLGVWAVVELGFLKGETGANRYGPDPRGVGASPGAAGPSRSTIMIAGGVVLMIAIAVVLTRLPFGGSNIDVSVSPAPAPPPHTTTGGDMMARIEGSPLQSSVRTAMTRARSASAAATHTAYSAREAKVRGRLAALEAVKHAPGYGTIDTTNTNEPRSFTGAVRNGEPDGYGILRWRSGDRTYSGQFQNGDLMGVGVFAMSKASYEGEFRQNEPDGVGVLFFDATNPDGERYSGEFANGLPEGYGLRTYPTARVFFGQWRAGKRDGYGAMFDVDGNMVEQGVYRADALIRPMTADD